MLGLQPGEKHAGLPHLRAEPVFILYSPPARATGLLRRLRALRGLHIEKSRFRSARPIRPPYPTWLFVMRPAKRRRTHAKNLPSLPLLHNKHYVNFSQCSAPYAPFARRSRPSAPPGGMPACSGYSPAKSMRGFRCLRAQPSDFIFTSSAVPQRGGLGTRHSNVLKSILFLQLKRKRIPAPAVAFTADTAF